MLIKDQDKSKNIAKFMLRGKSNKLKQNCPSNSNSEIKL